MTFSDNELQEENEEIHIERIQKNMNKTVKIDPKKQEKLKELEELETDPFPYLIPVLNFSKVDKILGEMSLPRPSPPPKNPKNEELLIFISEKNKKNSYPIGKKEPVKIGRDNKIPKGSEKDGTLSKHHCLVTYDLEKGKYFLQDLNSLNGTFINVPSGEELELVKGLSFEIDDDIGVVVLSVVESGVRFRLGTVKIDLVDFEKKTKTVKWMDNYKISKIGEGKFTISTENEEGFNLSF